MNLQPIIDADARLAILQTLEQDPSGSSSQLILQGALDAVAISRGVDYVRTQMCDLQKMGAVTLKDAGEIKIATITRTGLDHVERRSILEGVKRPDPAV